MFLEIAEHIGCIVGDFEFENIMNIFQVRKTSFEQFGGNDNMSLLIDIFLSEVYFSKRSR